MKKSIILSSVFLALGVGLWKYSSTDVSRDRGQLAGTTAEAKALANKTSNQQPKTSNRVRRTPLAQATEMPTAEELSSKVAYIVGFANEDRELTVAKKQQDYA